MTKWLLAGCAVASTVALASFAATGFGGEESEPEPLHAQAVATHAVAGPPAQMATPGKAASLFKVVYKETNTLSIPNGVTPFRLRSCPAGGAVLSAWHIRIGEDKAGVLATGSTPVGVRVMDYAVTNTTGGAVNGRLGLICIK